jgi:hypothetical protein
MMHFSRTAAILIALALSLSAQTAQAVLITFDDVVAPNGFALTAPLTTEYSALGVTFSGPAPSTGGAILDVSGGFGVGTHSGNNFLAFNRALYAKDPETLTFSSPVGFVSIFAAGGNTAVGSSFTLNAFDALNVLIATDTALATGPGYNELSVSASGITRVVLTQLGADNAFVYDDLTFVPAASGAVPEPSPLALIGISLALLVITRRRRKI